MRTGRLVIASTNPGKVRELRALLTGLDIEVVTPVDIGIDLDVVEDGDTFEANAALKARAFAAATGLPALADDSGLEVDALGGEPGIRSARWVPGSDGDRVAALLARLDGVPAARRSARFRCAVALAVPNPGVADRTWAGGSGDDAGGTAGAEVVATAAGAVEGRIAFAPRGANGFGYDPVFLVEDGGVDGAQTMAELAPEAKHRLSHRARALANIRGAIAAHVASSVAGGAPTIRPFAPADEDAVVALWQRCDLTRPWNDPRKDIARKSAVQAEWFLVGELDGRVVASTMTGYDGHRAWLYYVAVDPDARGRGIGRAMLAAVEARMRAVGCPKINLQVRIGNDAAMAFYRAVGYAVDDVVGMGKRLEAD